jgi:uncharacterized protein
MSQAHDFLDSTAKLLVDSPEAVSIECTVDDMGTLYTLKVKASEIGLVVGKLGATANALRTLLRAIGSKEKESAHLRIHDPKRNN